MSDEHLYDRIGVTYSATRRPDPRIERAIWDALGDAATVINVGAGAGAYEPAGRDVMAVEPSPVMVAQRPEGAAQVIEAQAEQLPFADGTFDAAMAVLSDHHWGGRREGLSELRRVARKRVVLFNGYWRDELAAILGEVRLVGVPVPHDCLDGFYGAFFESGAWHERHRDLLTLDELHLGYYVVVAELAD